MMILSKFGTKAAHIALFSALCLATGSLSGAKAEDKPSQPRASVKTAREEIKAFCAGIADAARDQRYELQKEELAKLQDQVNKRIAVLEQRKTDYETWLNQRNAFMKQAEAGLVDIYKKMKPDAAATQMNLLDPNLVSAIIMKLKPSQASLILSEMEPKKAAMITAIMSAVEQRDASRSPS
jgi:flagellar motility protein MotE (MotC chaperone)